MRLEKCEAREEESCVRVSLTSKEAEEYPGWSRVRLK